MNKLLTVLLATLFATTSFAASHAGAPMAGKPMEAMKAENPKGEAAAQAKVDARAKTGDASAMQPEAMKSGSDKAQVAAEKKNAKKSAGAKKMSSGERMDKDAAKL